MIEEAEKRIYIIVHYGLDYIELFNLKYDDLTFKENLTSIQRVYVRGAVRYTIINNTPKSSSNCKLIRNTLTLNWPTNCIVTVVAFLMSKPMNSGKYAISLMSIRYGRVNASLQKARAKQREREKARRNRKKTDWKNRLNDQR